MTQPAVDPNAQPAPRPRPPTLTHVVEHTEQTLRVIDENGVKSVQVTPKVTTWLVGQPVPGDDTTVVLAMFRTDDGGVRIWVRPKDGTAGAQHGLAFLIELPPAVVRFTMKTLHVSSLGAELAADERAFLYGEEDEDSNAPPEGEGQGEGDVGESADPNAPVVQTNGAPPPAAIGQG